MLNRSYYLRCWCCVGFVVLYLWWDSVFGPYVRTYCVSSPARCSTTDPVFTDIVPNGGKLALKKWKRKRKRKRTWKLTQFSSNSRISSLWFTWGARRGIHGFAVSSLGTWPGCVYHNLGLLPGGRTKHGYLHVVSTYPAHLPSV